MTAASARPVAEYAAHPDVVLVHDPVAAGAFGALASARDDELEEAWLFRRRPDVARYATHHRALVDALRKSVERVVFLSELLGDAPELEAARRNPNQVFTRDSLITLPSAPGRYLTARMRPPVRRSEAAASEAAARALGLEPLAQVPEGIYLEGGDVVPFSREGRRSLLVGYGPRTDIAGVEFLRQALVPEHLDEIIAVELAPWRMNLDGGLLPVTGDVALAEPESLRGGLLLDARGGTSVDVLGLLRDIGFRIVEVSREESIHAQACNGVCLRGRRFLCYDLSGRVDTELRRLDVETLRVPGAELVLGRGGPRCMTRPIY